MATNKGNQTPNPAALPGIDDAPVKPPKVLVSPDNPTDPTVGKLGKLIPKWLQRIAGGPDLGGSYGTLDYSDCSSFTPPRRDSSAQGLEVRLGTPSGLTSPKRTHSNADFSGGVEIHLNPATFTSSEASDDRDAIFMNTSGTSFNQPLTEAVMITDEMGKVSLNVTSRIRQSGEVYESDADENAETPTFQNEDNQHLSGERHRRNETLRMDPAELQLTSKITEAVPLGKRFPVATMDSLNEIKQKLLNDDHDEVFQLDDLAAGDKDNKKTLVRMDSSEDQYGKMSRKKSSKSSPVDGEMTPSWIRSHKSSEEDEPERQPSMAGRILAAGLPNHWFFKNPAADQDEIDKGDPSKRDEFRIRKKAREMSDMNMMAPQNL